MKSLFSLLLISLLIGGCKGKDDDDKNAVPSNLDFSTYQMYDVYGQAMGIHGTGMDDDYQQEDWAPWIYNLFTPLDTADLSGTVAGNVQFGRFFPNPASNGQAYSFTPATAVSLKMALIDKQGKVLYLASFKALPGSDMIQTLYDRNNIPAGDYRMYFGLSADGDPFFYRTHVDVGLN